MPFVHGFIAPNANTVDCSISLEVDDNYPHRSDLLEPLIERRDDGNFDVKWQNIQGNYNPFRRHFRGVSANNPSPLNAALRILTYFIGASRGILLLHAAGFVCPDGTAYVFSGHSGVGKTTIAQDAIKRFPSGKLLSDELLVITHEHGSNSSSVLGTPFWGTLELPGIPSSMPLRKLFFLKQSNLDRITALSPAQALSCLGKNVVAYWKSPDILKPMLATMTACAQSVTAYELCFRRELTFWRLLGYQ